MKYKTYLIQLTNLIKGIEKLQIQFVLIFFVWIYTQCNQLQTH